MISTPLSVPACVAKAPLRPSANYALQRDVPACVAKALRRDVPRIA